MLLPSFAEAGRGASIGALDPNPNQVNLLRRIDRNRDRQ